MRYIIFFITFFFAFNFSIISQNRNYYKNLKSKEKKSLAYSNKLLNEFENSKENIYDKLLLVESKLDNQETILKISKREIRLITEEINNEELRIAKFDSELDRLKEEYKKLIYYAHLNNSIQDRMIYILSASDFNSAYKRITYLRQLSVYRKEAYLNIERNRLLIDSTINLLKIKQVEKSRLLDNYNSERNMLKDSRINLKNEYEKLSLKIDDIKKEYAENENAKIKIKKNVKTEISNTSIAKNKVNQKAYKLNGKIGSKFSKYKRKLNWPLSKYVILHKFGDYYHPVLRGIVVKNDGIILGSRKGTNVYSIFEGQVINILDIPGSGTSIIIKHGEYFSVYSNVVNVEVKTGEIVKSGQHIARLSKIKKLAKLNFQLWKGKNKLNPKLWLK